jgi:hypothetical protein
MKSSIKESSKDQKMAVLGSNPTIRSEKTLQFNDHRPEAAIQRRLKTLMNNGPQEKKLQTLQAAVKPRSKTASEDVAQFFPYKRKNTRTNRTFQITNSGTELDAVQILGDKDDPHSGNLIYAIKPGSVELGHIISDPEEGSGIGSLLMLFLAQIAQQNGKDKITIPTAAPTAVGFYELLGFVSANKEGSDMVENRLLTSGDDIATAVERYVSHRAKVEFNTAPANHRYARRGQGPEKTRLSFDDLPQGERAQLEEEQMIRFGQMTDLERQNVITMMLHGRAVTLVGMTADVDVVISKATALCTRWKDADGWTDEQISSVWASRLDTSTLTEFPRKPDE